MTLDTGTLAVQSSSETDDVLNAYNLPQLNIQSSGSTLSAVSESEKSELNQLTLTLNDYSEATADGELIRLDGRLSRNGNQYEHLDGKINRFVSDSVKITDANFGCHIDRTPSRYEQDIVSIDFYGSEQIGATLATEVTSGEPIRIDVSGFDIATGYTEELNSFSFVGSL